MPFATFEVERRSLGVVCSCTVKQGNYNFFWGGAGADNVGCKGSLAQRKEILGILDAFIDLCMDNLDTAKENGAGGGGGFGSAAMTFSPKMWPFELKCSSLASHPLLICAPHHSNVFESTMSSPHNQHQAGCGTVTFVIRSNKLKLICGDRLQVFDRNRQNHRPSPNHSEGQKKKAHCPGLQFGQK